MSRGFPNANPRVFTRPDFPVRPIERTPSPEKSLENIIRNNDQLFLQNQRLKKKLQILKSSEKNKEINLSIASVKKVNPFYEQAITRLIQRPLSTVSNSPNYLKQYQTLPIEKQIIQPVQLTPKRRDRASIFSDRDLPFQESLSTKIHMPSTQTVQLKQKSFRKQRSININNGPQQSFDHEVVAQELEQSKSLQAQISMQIKVNQFSPKPSLNKEDHRLSQKTISEVQLLRKENARLKQQFQKNQVLLECRNKQYMQVMEQLSKKEKQVQSVRVMLELKDQATQDIRQQIQIYRQSEENRQSQIAKSDKANQLQEQLKFQKQMVALLENTNQNLSIRLQKIQSSHQECRKAAQAIVRIVQQMRPKTPGQLLGSLWGIEQSARGLMQGQK